MDELAQARRLLKELLGARAAIVAQRAKIDELIRTRPAAINSLPTERLLFILDLDTNTVHRDYLKRKQELAGICRRWRDIILGSPLFWTTIHVAKSNSSSILTHLERSRGAPLDIPIQVTPWARLKILTIVPSLDIVTSCAHRWRSLLIDSDSRDRYDKPYMPPPEFIIERIDHLLSFPQMC